MPMHTKDDIKYIKNMENNKVDENDLPIYMCAINKKVDEINKKYFDENKNESFEVKKSIKYYVDNEKGTPTEIQTLPSNRLTFIKETTKRGDDIILKNMKVMITENIDVNNGICNGTTGHITEIKKEKGKETYIIGVLTKDNKK